MNDHDPGDEHADAPPVPLDRLSALLAQWSEDGDPCVEMSRELFDIVTRAEEARWCCEECSREARGVEDAA